MLGVYTLQPASGGATQVQYTFETEPAQLSDKLMENLVVRSWTKRKAAKAMRRLRVDPRGRLRARRRAPPTRRSSRRRVARVRPRYASAAVNVRRLWILACALAVALAVAACGSSNNPSANEQSTVGQLSGHEVGSEINDGSYIQAGPITYQLQISRELNPYSVQDARTVKGLPDGVPAADRRPVLVRRVPVGQEPASQALSDVRQLRDRRHHGRRLPADQAEPAS